MDRLQSMRVFCRVAMLGSFTRATTELGLSPAVASRLVADLEQHLRTRLLNRTTRIVKLTEAGHAYFLQCQNILELVDEAEARAGGLEDQASGTLRMLVSFSEGLQLLAPHFVEFRRRHPGVVLDIQLAERSIDLVEEGFDIAIQPRPFIFSNKVIARNLMRAGLILCAAPGYLQQRGTPLTPHDLDLHDCVNFSDDGLRDRWLLQGAVGGETPVKPRNVLISNNIEALFGAIRSGMGIGVAFENLIRQDLEKGLLVRVLPDYHLLSMDYYIIYPSRKYLPLKVRAMINFLLEVFKTDTAAGAA